MTLPTSFPQAPVVGATMFVDCRAAELYDEVHEVRGARQRALPLQTVTLLAHAGHLYAQLGAGGGVDDARDYDPRKRVVRDFRRDERQPNDRGAQRPNVLGQRPQGICALQLAHDAVPVHQARAQLLVLHPAVDRHQVLRGRDDQAVRQQGAPVLERSLRPVEHDYHLWRLRKVGLEEVSKGGEARVLERDPERPRRLWRQVAARHVPHGIACRALQALPGTRCCTPACPRPAEGCTAESTRRPRKTAWRSPRLTSPAGPPQSSA